MEGRWILGVGVLLKNSVSYSKFVFAQTGGGQPNVDRVGQKSFKMCGHRLWIARMLSLPPLSINKPIYQLLPLPQCFSFLQESLGPFMIFSEISNPYNFSGRFCVRTKWMMAKRKADNHFICTIHVKKIYVMPVLTFRIEKN